MVEGGVINTQYSSLVINIWFGLVVFYGISTIVGYLMPNLLYTYIHTYIQIKDMILKPIVSW